jgi:hypothetical protein
MEGDGAATRSLAADGAVPSLAQLEGSFARLSPAEAREAYATSAAAFRQTWRPSNAAAIP